MTNLRTRITAAWLTRSSKLAWSLLPLSWLYSWVIAVRQLAYRRGWLPCYQLPVPVIVVGNRIVGGAGKTPTTIALANHLRQQGWHIGIVSRGYGRTQEELSLINATTPSHLVGDEPLLMWRRTAATPIAVGRDRVAAARYLLQQHPDIELILCDDGLQHLRLARDIEVIVFDERGTGNGWLLPAGPLREPFKSRPMAAQQLILYNAAEPTTSLPGYSSQRSLQGLYRLADWWSTKTLASSAPPRLDATWLAVAGIAVPERFFNQLHSWGQQFRCLALPDHFGYHTIPWSQAETHIVLTEKDAIKLLPERMLRERPHQQIWVATLDFVPAKDFFSAIDLALKNITKGPIQRCPPLHS